MKRTYLEQTESAVLGTESGREYVMEAKLQGEEGSEILEIDVYGKKDGNGEREFICRHFLSVCGSEYATLFMTEQTFKRKTYRAGDWTALKLESVFTRGDYMWGYYGLEKIGYSKETEAIIRQYCKEEHMQADRQITYLEDRISSVRRENRYHRKMERIDALMSRVGPVTTEPEFERWIRQEVFREHYLFAETRKLKRGYRCRCTACGKLYYQKNKPGHNREEECRKCGKRVTVKTRVANIIKQESVMVVQAHEKGILIRHFRFQAAYGTICGKTGMFLKSMERIRIFQEERRSRLYYGCDREWGADEFQQDWWTTKGGMVMDHSFRLYPGTLSEAGLAPGQKSALLGAAAAGARMDYNRLLWYWRDMPYMEYLLKGRYYRLAGDLLGDYCWGGEGKRMRDREAESIPDLLGLDAQRANRLRDMDGGVEALKFLRREREEGTRIPQELLEFADRKRIDPDVLETGRTGLPANRALSYIRRQMERTGRSYADILQTYSDYLDMAAERGMDLTDDIVRINTRMVEFHDRYVEEKNREKEEKRIREAGKRFPGIARDYQRNCREMAWENGEYCITVPRNAGEIIEEGKKQHHCVGASDTYMKRMAERESFILFLRKKETPDEPYYTLEVKGTDILQSYGAYDRKPDFEKVEKVLAGWKRDIRKRRKEENRKKEDRKEEKLPQAAGQERT